MKNSTESSSTAKSYDNPAAAQQACQEALLKANAKAPASPKTLILFFEIAHTSPY
ncbi:hypothetical protein [Marinomonas sp. A3A]|uniref:hypothetical protein n=1 Tax=Marinomonas sp. A3A TaxID=2065312 RepID=UPI001BB42D4A|nr:hypothetical protein [Marinomonas sp. A3A]